ncbi:MAG: hypothetical protein HYV63_07080 [Candidatus Schekmanbacteria bacterium]|nr:hypothetical protein [Candidatus Schekmanbacteria bacterium]
MDRTRSLIPWFGACPPLPTPGRLAPPLPRYVIGAVLLAVVVAPGHAFGWGEIYHAQVARDAIAVAPAEMRQAFTPYADHVMAAVMEPHALWGAEHEVPELLQKEIERAAHLADSNPFKWFKALMRVAHLAADAVNPCPQGAEQRLSSDRLIQLAVKQDEGFPVRIEALPEPLGAVSPAPTTSPCGDHDLDVNHVGVVRTILAAWLEIYKRAGMQPGELAGPIQIRQPSPEKEPVSGVETDLAVWAKERARLVEQAREAYRRRAQEADQASTAAAYLSLAEWCDGQHLVAERDAALTATLRVDPNNKAAHEKLGHEYFEGTWLSRKQALRLKREQRQRQAKEAGTAQAYVDLGNWCESNGLSAEATEAYRQALTIDPRNAAARAKLGRESTPSAETTAAERTGSESRWGELARSTHSDLRDAEAYLSEMQRVYRIATPLERLDLDTQMAEARSRYESAKAAAGRLEEDCRKAPDCQPGYIRQ